VKSVIIVALYGNFSANQILREIDFKKLEVQVQQFKNPQS